MNKNKTETKDRTNENKSNRIEYPINNNIIKSK